MNQGKKTKVQTQLIKKFHRLSPTLQKIVQVAAVNFDEINRTNLISLASDCGISDEQDRPVKYKNLREELRAAIDDGVLTHTGHSQSGPIVVAPRLCDYVFRQALGSGLVETVFTQLEETKRKSARAYYYRSEATAVREMRTMFYRGDYKGWVEHLERFEIRPIVLDPFCNKDFEKLTPEFQQDFLDDTVQRSILGSSFLDPNLQMHFQHLADSTDFPKSLITTAIDYFAFKGDVEALEKLASQLTKQKIARSEIAGCIAFLQGDYASAISRFELAVKEFRKRTRKRTVEIRHVSSAFYALALLLENSPSAQKELKALSRAINKWENAFSMFAFPIDMALTKQVNPTLAQRFRSYGADEVYPVFYWLCSLIWCWLMPDEKFPFQLKLFTEIAAGYRAGGITWLAAEMEAIAAKVTSSKSKSANLSSTSTQSHLQLGTVSLVDKMKPMPAWDAGLKALENLCSGSNDQKQAADSVAQLKDERMIWEVGISDGGSWFHLTPYIQKLGKKGWSKGRKVGLERLFEQWQTSAFELLTDQDREICRCLTQSYDVNYYGYREKTHEWNYTRLATAVLGHPCIFHVGQRDQTVEISAAQPMLSITQKSGNIKLTVTPQSKGEELLVTKESAHRISITQFNDQQKKVTALIAEMPTIPQSQQDRVAQLSQSVSSIIGVQSDIEGAVISSGETVAADSSIVVQLTTYGEGLRAELLVHPLGAQGPFCRPGNGSAAVFANIDGKPLSTTRDLKTERKNWKQLLANCNALDSRTIDNHQSEWLFHDSESSLELVVELHDLTQQENVTVLWPRGKSHDLAGSASTGNFQVSVKRDRDWFAVSGELKIDEELTLDMMRLVEMVNASPTRFLQLDDGRFVALTQELRQRIADIAAFSKSAKGKFRIPSVRAMHVDELLQGTKLKTDKHWKQHLARITEAGDIDTQPPKNLQAKLRDYQSDGFGWLKRLSHWSTGACLADDMGLGKTIQALGLLLERASQGPALVIAPASVGFNWESESRKFAPSLTPKLYRNFDRTTFFDDLKPGDLVIASYGLLQSNADEFAGVQWATVLLDEAQAIKNMDTKRSQAAMQLQADFRVILTGTPLENHLGELWNLIRFISPGLLGSHDDFRKRYAIPIERDQCRQSRNRLRKLIQPFLLRRTKSEVLAELPSRTETVLEVEMSPAEVALYEAVRLKAIENIENASDDTKKGQKHLRVLAELTRLRLACCHPSLVGGNEIEGSKLDLFRHKVREIVDGQHKVLVFNQFVKHLSILRNELDEMGISYQYLDGSTPAKKRKQIVESFQAGEGDVFLISLKAGGTGLNLTAADYVLHMDPWWNPAVEDQATDRAHRIGQTRPVNVYRLVTKGTIEEKIVELHHTKRDLADSLLAGTDTAAKLTTEDLISLLKENSLQPQG